MYIKLFRVLIIHGASLKILEAKINIKNNIQKYNRMNRIYL